MHSHTATTSMTIQLFPVSPVTVNAKTLDANMATIIWISQVASFFRGFMAWRSRIPVFFCWVKAFASLKSQFQSIA